MSRPDGDGDGDGDGGCGKVGALLLLGLFLILVIAKFSSEGSSKAASSMASSMLPFQGRLLSLCGFGFSMGLLLLIPLILAILLPRS